MSSSHPQHNQTPDDIKVWPHVSNRSAEYVIYRVPHRSRFQEVWSFFIVGGRIFLVNLIRHKFSPVQIADTFIVQEVRFSKKLAYISFGGC